MKKRSPKNGARPVPETKAITVSLSEREQAVIRGIAAGKSYEQIAVDLNLGFETVRTHVRTVRKKLGLTKAGIAAWAVREGLVA